VSLLTIYINKDTFFLSYCQLSCFVSLFKSLIFHKRLPLFRSDILFFPIFQSLLMADLLLPSL
jgi:hypothetical protein